MKKLLILVLILGLTSAANAAISYTYGFTDTAGGAISSAPSDENFVFTVSRDTITGNWSDSWKIYDPDQAGTNIANFKSDGATKTAAAGGQGAISAYSTTYDGFDLSGGDAGAQGTEIWTGGVMFNLTVIPSATGTFTVYNYTSDYVTMIDSASINIVPEPMTIALLGLGGLFLRRRK